MNAVRLSTSAASTPTTMPIRYREIITGTAWSGKNTAVNRAYMGSFAEQLMNGVSMTVILRSCSDGSVRVAMIAGTEQPKPISMGTKLRPERPSLRKSLSITNATRAI